jgi:hypothetical protein
MWDSWSAKGKTYKGRLDLKTHWLSFKSTPGKALVTAGSFLKEEAASADEFEVVVPPEPVPLLPGEPDKLKTKNDARAWLEHRLVFVANMERYFDTERHTLMGETGVRHLFTGRMPRLGPNNGRLDPMKLLLESPTKPIVDSMGFHPGESATFTYKDFTYANRYRNRLPAPLEPSAVERETIEWLFARIEDEPFRNWLLQLLAHVVQKPAVKIRSAPLIWSRTTGNGKTTLLRKIPSLLVGPEYSVEVSFSLLNSDFNDYLANTWHVNLTEFRAANRNARTAIADKLKPYVAEDVVSMHPKGLPAYTMPNHFFVTATSNAADATPLDTTERRWGIYELPAPQMNAEERERAYTKFLNTERAAAVLRHFFLCLPLTFDPDAEAVYTEDRAAMIEETVPSDVDVMRQAFDERRAPFDRDVVLVSEVQDWLQQKLKFMPSSKTVARNLQAHFGATMRKVNDKGAMYRVWVLRNHKRWESTSPTDIIAQVHGDGIGVDIR